MEPAKAFQKNGVVGEFIEITGTTAANKTIDYVKFGGSGGLVTGTRFKEIQICEESSSTYEPYVTPIKTNIYLDQPLRKIGAYEDYIDFKKQKVYRNVSVIDDTGTLTIAESLRGNTDNTGTDIKLPKIPTTYGTTIIEVDTSVKPSKIEIDK